MKLTGIRTFATKLRATSLGSSTAPVQTLGSKFLTIVYGRAKDVVAAMIKRLAHRNANVQLYTLEVDQGDSECEGPNLTCAFSSRTPCLKTAELLCIENWHPEASQMLSYD